VLKALRDSGQMMKMVETKEFMDSKLKNISMSDIFAFNININKKKLFPQSDTQEQKEKARQRNESLLEAVADVGTDESYLAQNKNKYVMIADIPTIKARKSLAQDVYDLQLEVEKWASEEEKQERIDEVAKYSQMEREALINEEILSFYQTNLGFWKEVITMFNQIL
jgi:hypothetical protein